MILLDTNIFHRSLLPAGWALPCEQAAAIVTWNKKDLEGRTDRQLCTPAEYLAILESTE